ncbi:MAG: response regulator transcription factor [Acidimicrobiia bacterium]
MIRVWIADDHTLFAQGLGRALDAVPDIRVVGISASATELLEGIGTQPAEVCITDLEMPGGGGAAVLRKLEHTPVIVVSMHADDAQRQAAAQAGAAGFFSKSAPLTVIASAVRAVAAGERLDVNDEMATEAALAAYSEPTLDPGAASLTDREREILGHLARGVSATDELAEILFISQKTVKNHLASIFQKLAVSDRTQAAVEAIRLGLAEERP